MKSNISPYIHKYLICLHQCCSYMVLTAYSSCFQNFAVLEAKAAQHMVPLLFHCPEPQV